MKLEYLIATLVAVIAGAYFCLLFKEQVIEFVDHTAKLITGV